MTTPRPTRERLRIERLAADRDRREQLAGDVLAGLTATPRTLPPKWFYDARGSELFEQITRLPEYYQTRTEAAILAAVADELVAELRPRTLIEIGSGSSRKTRLLLDALQRGGSSPTYVPVDVSEDALLAAAERLLADYPDLAVHAVVGDFEEHLPALPDGDRPRLVAFLGSTIGNLEPPAQVAFLRDITALLQPGDALLLGIDLVKDRATLVAAYDDARGVTAEFNRNVLRVLNRELGADLPEDAFVHEARWVPEHARIEMWLRATRPVVATFPDLDLVVRFAAGEGLRTEISCKFTRASLAERAAGAGLVVRRFDTDPDGRFALALLGV